MLLAPALNLLRVGLVHRTPRSRLGARRQVLVVYGIAEYAAGRPARPEVTTPSARSSDAPHRQRRMHPLRGERSTSQRNHPRDPAV
jgi:hypothetical protein